MANLILDTRKGLAKLANPFLVSIPSMPTLVESPILSWISLQDQRLS